MLLFLIKIVHGCLSFCYISSSWKLATTIPKPGEDSKDPVNYIIIALIILIAKFLDKIILEELQKQLVDKMRPEQSESRSHRYTTQKSDQHS